MRVYSDIYAAVFLFVVAFKSASCLDCYSCSNEHHNWMSCTKNIVQCKSFQDACVSYTSFHRFIEYHPRSERWHNISKGCDTMEACERRAAAVNDALCDRSSYHEWACIECCRGDLCNYFVTLGSSRTFGLTSKMLLLLCALVSMTTPIPRLLS